MKRKCPNSAASSCSSSSSSCCIESPLIAENDDDDDHKSLNNNNNNNKKKKKQPNNKRSSVRGSKKIEGGAGVDNSAATSPKSRSSIYRGVTRHRWTGRFEAHLWDKTTWNTIQNKRGRQIYLGAYDNEEDAARTYDLAALKYWGPGPASILNFPVDRYRREVEEMEKMSKEEFLASLRRRSSGFSRGVSKYRGVARHHHNGRWEARIGRVCGNKYLYLGTYSTQEEAAAAYDRAAIEFRGPNAVTNFEISNYANKLKKVPSDIDVQVEHDDIQVKQETLNQVQEDDHQEDGNQVVQPSNVPKLEFNDSQATVVKEQFNKVQSNDNQEEANQLVQTSNILKFESIDSRDIVVVMDPTEEHEHPWDLCLDIGFNSLPIPDIPLEKSSSEVLGLLDDKGFEDDIEFIFDGQFSDREFLQDAISGTGECKAEADVLVGPDVSNSPSSSPLSTTTSVCSNI